MPRGHYGKQRHAPVVQHDFWSGVPVGAVVHHIGELEPALQKLDSEFAILLREFCSHIGVDPNDLVFTRKRVAEIAQDPMTWTKRLREATDKLEQSPLHPFWTSYLKPLTDEWNAFLEDPFTVTEAAAPWLGMEKLENWQNRLVQARAAVNKVLEQHGKPKLESPDPAPLPKSTAERAGGAVEDVAGGAGDLVSTLLGGAKWVVIGILGLAGVVAVASIVHNVRENKDPVREYASVYRGRGH